MKSKNNNIVIKNKDIISVFAATAGILMLPLIGIQVDSDVDWSISDFLLMGTLISGTGLLIVLVARKVKNTTHRGALILALLAALFLTWVHLAVGIVDTAPFAGS